MGRTPQLILFISAIVLVFIPLTSLSSIAGIILPRVGAFIELDPVTTENPWQDRSSRVQWVLARLQNEGLRVWLLDPKGPMGDCQVIYLDGPPFKGILSPLKNRGTGILQSASRKVLEEGFFIRKVQASPRVSLEFHQSGSRRVVTVSPDLSECFKDYPAIEALARAVIWLAHLPEEAPRVAPFPEAKCSAVVFIVHGEGETKKIELFHRQFLEAPGRLTYVVSEEAIQNYPSIVIRFVRHPQHEVAIHNHNMREHETQDKILSAHVELHQKALEGHKPLGWVGPYLRYHEDFREALLEHQFRWFLDKDLPYPLNLPAPPDTEPVIDITESLKPYDGWWRRRDAQALWSLGLNWKRLRNEIAVCSWHDVHMASEPEPFHQFMHEVKELNDVWQTTALNLQTFWRDRWRAHIEILSNDDRSVTLRTRQAPIGLTLMRNRKGSREVAILMKESSGENRLEWKPMSLRDDPDQQKSLQVRWSPIGSIMPRNGLDTEFALINPGEKMVVDEPFALILPETLRSRIGQTLPTTLRVSIAGVKGLKFQEIKTEIIHQKGPIPNSISFQVERLPPKSIQFYRLRFPIEKKTSRLDRLLRSLKKRRWVMVGIGMAVFAGVGLGGWFILRRKKFPNQG